MIKHTLDFAEYRPEIGKSLIYGYPYGYRSAFLNQYFEDAINLAHSEGRRILYHSSLFANYRVLKRAKEEMGLKDSGELMNFLESFFMSMGYGSLTVAKEDIKVVASPIAHTYLYVHHTPSETPICNFQRGFISAALDLLLDAEPGSVFVEETQCVAMQDPVCRMVPEVKRMEVEFPEVDYSQIDYHTEDDPDFMNKVGLLRQAIPIADDTGNIHIRSAYSGLKRASFMYFPTDYFSYATWKALTEGNFQTADLMLRFTGYAGFLMTFVSLYYTPIGKIAYGNPDTPEDLFRAIMGSMKYWGMGFWNVAEVREGRTVAKVHNFYENDFQRLVGAGEPYSPYVVGGILGLLYAIYRVRFYLREDPMFISEAVQSYDEVVSSFKVSSHFDPQENAQIVEVEW